MAGLFALMLFLAARPSDAYTQSGWTRAPGGIFLQYQYWLTQKDELRRWFTDVKVGFTLVNIPPAFVYECRGVLARAAS